MKLNRKLKKVEEHWSHQKKMGVNPCPRRELAVSVSYTHIVNFGKSLLNDRGEIYVKGRKLIANWEMGHSVRNND
jgi:hypothetical protein